jgi:hypothetical protein
LVWTVCADGEEHALYAGIGAKGRAIESALRLAEELRVSAAVVVVVVESEPRRKRDNNETPVTRNRLAS